MIKILFCSYDKTGHISTGPNAWLQRLIPDLIQNYNLEVITCFIYSGKEEECPTINYFKTEKLPIITINRKANVLIEDQVKELLKIVNQNQINIVVANLVIPAFYAAKYLKRQGIPTIGVLHSNDAFYRSVIKKFVLGKVENQFSAVVSVSEYIKKISQTNEKNIPNYVIPCGTPLTTYKAKWNEDGKLKVIYAGRLVVEQKQIIKLSHAFCEASKLDNRVFFNIFGNGDQENSIAEIILAKNCQHKVQLNKALPPSAIIQKIAEHQVFTLMSDYEGMPVALMEAMSCGVVPVCLEEASGINEIIEHGKNGFIVKNRHDDYQKHLLLLLNNPNLWKELSENAKKTIKEKYSAEITHKQWFNLLKSYETIKIKSFKLPRSIKLEGELLHYGDNRKKPFFETIQSDLNKKWFKFKLLVRPRSRIRSVLQQKHK